ncbi:MAG: prepilin-type N-terminal cleavage/methylation domain-containing protein [Clostridiales bacterium]|nr:prepilin-type N-terminal cleavage/methylation domain-containing protein [Clostridiales bacterium]
MRKILHSRNGFTLVELMMVVLVMAILVAVAIPIYGAVTANAQKKTCAANVKILSDTLASYKMGIMTTKLPEKVPNIKIVPNVNKNGVDWALTTLDYNNIDNTGTVLTVTSFFNYFTESPYCPAGGTLTVTPDAENSFEITCSEHS